ncbi:hypothetical protein I7I48_09123 [Histoplasma ohiense]|nr:hypothetical protein I7I48_09123 [Histoplasma ohiense (nom. inval.)]
MHHATAAKRNSVVRMSGSRQIDGGGVFYQSPTTNAENRCRMKHKYHSPANGSSVAVLVTPIANSPGLSEKRI